jgi:adenine-specific DNA-methyltransferase
MEKLKMHSPNFVDQNIAKIAELFPNCVTESRNEKGELQRAIDFDLLKQELSAQIVEGPQERYQLNWPGKREALLTANAPIAKTLRPCREESVDFDTTQNLFIEGDNLDALKLLQETYLGKVKMIYIDPPYNTGTDFIYEDDFAEDAEEYKLRSNEVDEVGNRLIANNESNGRFHSDWLSMMYTRIRLAINFLADDGVIFISIDDHEVSGLRKLCDEVFGGDNFVAQLIWEKIQTRKNSARYFSESHDYILCYAKSKSRWNRNLIPRENDSIYKNPDDDPKGPWKLDRIYANNPYNASYTITNPITGEVFPRPPGKYWRYSEETIKRFSENGQLIFSAKPGAYPNVKRYLVDVQDGLVPTTIFDRDFAGDNGLASRELTDLLGLEKIMDYPKPTKLIKRLLQIGSNKNDLVMDFFAGSATTADAVIQLSAQDGSDRHFILVQIPEPISEKSDSFTRGYKTIAEISKERIRRAGQKIKEENADKEGIENLDIGFRVLKIDTSNMAEVYYNPAAISQEDLFTQVDNLKPDRTEEDLLFQVMLDWGVDLTLPIRRETIANKTVFFVDKNALVACFDKQGTIDDEFVKELAKHQPVRAVFRDAGFKDDSAKINVEQVFKLLSPITKVKTL